MSEQVKLREFTNAVRVIGTLKEMNLENKPAAAGKNWARQIQGNIVILSIVDGKVSEHRVELFAKDTSKLFKGYETIMKEYRAIDVVGKENATRLNVTGSIDGNDYMGQDGQLREVNRIRGLFVNRVEDDSVQDEAIAQLELVVTGLRELTDKEGVETGEVAIDGFTVGYNNNIISLKNLVVGADLAHVITNNYDQNSTGKLTFKINNYVEVAEKPAAADPFADGGFGINVDIGNEARNYTRNLQVIGGFPPYIDERALDDEQIALAKKIRALKLQEVKNSVPATPPGGFGQSGMTPAGKPVDGFPGAVDISDDDLPF